MRCDKCRHWKPKGTEDWEAERVGFGECMGVRERWVITDEASRGIKWSPDDDDFDEYDLTAVPRPDSYTGVRRAALRAARAYVQDGSEYRAELYTAPDFFCALFAQGIEAPSGDETRSGSAVGESPVGEADAP